MKKFIAVLSVFIQCAFYTLAQTVKQDVVYLKNGSIIRGDIIEQIPNQSLKIETYDRSVFVYKFEEIEKITKEEVAKPGKNNAVVNTAKKSNYLFMMEFGFCPGVGNIKTDGNEYSNEDQIINIQMIHAARVDPNLSIGLGIGLDALKDVNQIPVFLDIRPYFSKTATTGFFALDVGYNIGTKKETLNYGYGGDITVKDKGGLMINPQFGVKTAIGNNAAFSFAFGFKYLEDNASVTGYGNSDSGKATGGFITFRISIGTD